MSWRASLAYVCALLVGFLISTLGVFWGDLELGLRALRHGEPLDSAVPGSARLVVMFALSMTITCGALAAPVFAALIILARRLGLPRPLTDVFIGVVFGIAAAIPFTIFAETDLIGWVSFLLAGLAGGVSYWIVAGRPMALSA